MSIIETLTEGIVNRNMEQEGAALLNKWTATGLLEGLNESQQANMAVLLENQAKSLLKEASSMKGGNIEGFAAVAFPIVRRVFAGLIANDLVSVQPMSLPSGLIFFMDFVFSKSLNGTDVAGRDRFGNVADQSLYGTNRVGSQITGGVSLTGDLGSNLPGPRESVGYAYASPITSVDVTSSAITIGENAVISALTEAQKKLIRYDADVLAESTSSLLELKIPETTFTNLDLDNLAAINVSGTAVNAVNSLTNSDDNTKLIRRLTQTDGTNVRLYFVSSV